MLLIYYRKNIKNTHMKKYFFIAFLLLGSAGAFAQKFAYVDSEYILKQIPEYTAAISTLDGASKQWQQQVDLNFADIDKMYKSYQADRVLLTDDMRKRRENEIIEKEKQAKEFQREKFGPNGELFVKRTELLKPIQERVSEAVKQLAKAKYLDFIFDKSSESTMMIYASTSYDLSKEVIVKLGYKPGVNN